MIQLSRTLAAWGTPDFEGTLKGELEQLDAGELPLQQGLSGTSHVAGSAHQVMVIGAAEVNGIIRAKVGVFYSGMLIGCSCADDPTPVEEQPEYCVIQLDIDRDSGEARATLLSE